MAAAAKADVAVPRSQKFNIGQYRGLLDTVQHVKDKVDRERGEAELREKGLKEQLADKVVKGEKVQKELSVQLRCAGRSYAQILDANREIEQRMYVEIDKRDEEIVALKKVIKVRDDVIRIADKPWREKLAKQELKLLKLAENNEDLKKKVYEEGVKIPPIHVHYKKRISEMELAMESVLHETAGLREVIKENEEAHVVEVQKIKAPFAKQILDLQKVNRDITEAADDREAGFKRDIKRLENKNVGLQKELDKVDHTPYERKIDTLQDGFNRLVKDFEIKTQLNSESVSKMREGFETVIEGLDNKIQLHEREHERRLKPYEEEIARKQFKLESLQEKIEEMRESEAEVREKDAAVIKELRDELKVCKEAVDLYLKELNQSKRNLEQAQQELQSDNGPYKKMKQYERRLEEVTEQCAAMIKHKDCEISAKNAIVGRLQKKLEEDAKRLEDFGQTWDKRIQEKEKGYNKACAELAFAEGQIVEERKRTQVEKDKVKARERDIARLKAEHTEELRVREIYRQQLEVTIEELEVKVEEEAEQRIGDRLKVEVAFDAFRRRNEEHIADLTVEMARRDRLKEEVDIKLTEIQQQWEAARVEWEEKDRDLEVNIRTRDRTILALKNELEFLNDNWEIKYARLVLLYEKVQKRYEETIGANGQQEAFRRAIGLKAENETLHTMIHELRETIQKQRKVIRGLQLDIDQLMKETADMLAEKERGIAEMAGDYVKLENKYRDEQVLRARLLKQKDAERLALAESFQARVEQLEQIMEAMRFNDRQELMDKIALWKKNYERVCNERDDVEDHYKDIVERKELQVQNLIVDQQKECDKTEAAILEGKEKLAACEMHWKKQSVGWAKEKEESEQKHRDLEVDLGKARFQHERALIMGEKPKEDPQIAILKAKIAECQEEIKAMDVGKQMLIEENSALRVETVSVDTQMEDVHAIYKPQLEAKDKEISKMIVMHDELKEILKLEMKRAQDTCRDIEEQVKRFPDPFIDEIQEMKDKYNQMQAGMQKIQVENLHLREEGEKTRKHLEKEIKGLEKSLGLAKTLLHEVSTLESLKHLSTSEARKAQDDLGLKL